MKASEEVKTPSKYQHGQDELTSDISSSNPHFGQGRLMSTPSQGSMRGVQESRRKASSVSASVCAVQSLRDDDDVYDRLMHQRPAAWENGAHFKRPKHLGRMFERQRYLTLPVSRARKRPVCTMLQGDQAMCADLTAFPSEHQPQDIECCTHGLGMIDEGRRTAPAARTVWKDPALQDWQQAWLYDLPGCACCMAC